MVQHLSVGEQMYFCGWSQYGGMIFEETTRLKVLELKDSRLKKVLAEAALDKVLS